MEKLWGGRFQKEPNDLMDEFNSSIGFDYKLYEYDIQGSIAHATMLGQTCIITKEESNKIISALKEIKSDIKNGKVEFSIKNEDIHMNIESFLIEKIGETGKKLHTARSRNDQVALDTKLYCKAKVCELKESLNNWILTLCDIAKKHTQTIMPGYTHLQRAQPITFAHILMAYTEMAKRDYIRLDSWQKLHNTMPLGAGALAGTTFALDRQLVADILGFEKITMNSLDSVSDRDFVLDLMYDASVGMMHLSRMCEELVIWSSQEFSFVEFDDEYATGSSMMPQKKNPDIAELVRGKTGRTYGNLMALLTTMKSLPLAYNKDMQEDKEGLFDSVDTWAMSLEIMTSAMKSLTVKSQNMKKAANSGFVNATDLADYLVKKGVAFRDSHKITGEIIFNCIKNNCNLEDITIEEYKKYSNLIENDVYKAIDVTNCVEKREIVGAPNKARVSEHINMILDEFKK